MVNTFRAVSGHIGAKFDTSSTTPKAAVGTIVQGNGGSEWVYCIASGTITAYMACGINEDFDVYPLTTALAVQSDKLGFPQIAIASGSYAWVPTRGASGLKVRTKASAAADAQLWTTASAGVLDDATAASALKIDGMVLVAAAGTAANGAAGIAIKAAWPAIRET